MTLPPQPLSSGQMPGHGLVQAQLSLLGEHQHGHCGHLLRGGGHVEGRGGVVRPPGLHIGQAVGALEENFAVPEHGHGDAGDVAVELGEDPVDLLLRSRSGIAMAGGWQRGSEGHPGAGREPQRRSRLQGGFQRQHPGSIPEGWRLVLEHFPPRPGTVFRSIHSRRPNRQKSARSCRARPSSPGMRSASTSGTGKQDLPSRRQS